jgi:polysaccharide biosynthesis transport protein
MEETYNQTIDPIKVAWARKWPLLLFSLVFTTVAYFAAFLLPKIYESESTVLIIPPKFNKSDRESDSLSIGSYRDLIYTSGFLQSIIEQLKSKTPKVSYPLYPENLKSMIFIDTPVAASGESNASQLITFKVRGQDPVIITEIANILITLLASESRKMRANEIANISKFTRTHYLSNKEALATQEQALETFRQEHILKNSRLEQALGKTKLKPPTLAKRTKDLNKSESALAILQLKKSTLQFNEIEIHNTRLDLSESTSRVISLRTQATSHPDLLMEKFLKEERGRDVLLAKEKFLAESIKSLKSIIPDLENKYFAMKAEEERTKLEVELEIELEKRGIELEKKQLALKKQLREEQAGREILALKNSFDILSKRLEEVQISESEKTSDIRLISKAIAPHIPISPNIMKIVLIAFVVSLTLGGSVAIAKEHLDNVS